VSEKTAEEKAEKKPERKSQEAPRKPGRQELLERAAQAHRKQELPDFQIGDTVGVHCRIVEGEKERIQVFTGTVIGRRGSGISEMFTVRRIVNNEGVERTFPLHSPRIADVEVVRSGRARRAKLYFLRDRVGKATRLKEVKRALTVPGEAEPGADDEAPDDAERDEA
jgi:large subunit ribosomal protein L19